MFNGIIICIYNQAQWHSQYRGKGGRVPPSTAKKCQKSGRGKKSGKREENRGKEEKSGRKGQNREGSFTLPLLTDRAGHATDQAEHSSLSFW